MVALDLFNKPYRSERFDVAAEEYYIQNRLSGSQNCLQNTGCAETSRDDRREGHWKERLSGERPFSTKRDG